MNCRPQCNKFPDRCMPRCEACKELLQKYPSCPQKQVYCPPVCTSTKATYLYSEKGPASFTRDDSNIRRTDRSRPSSAGSARSAQSKRSNGNSSKNASSDSKILKKGKDAPKSNKNNKFSRNGRHNKEDPKIDPESVQQLKQDLNTIKKQLTFLTNKENFSPDLQVRCQDLLQQNKLQQQEIENLKFQNETLSKKINNQTVLEGESLNEIITTKSCLDKYETTLNSLYNELLSSTKAIETKMCCCKKDNSTQGISRSQNSDDSNYDKMLKKCQKLKDNEKKYAQQNEILLQTIQELENQLEQSLLQLDMFRKEAAATSMIQQQEMEKRNHSYVYQLELKSKEVNELSLAVEELKKQMTCPCYNQSGDANSPTNSEYRQLLAKHQAVVEKLNISEETNAARFQEIQILKKNEKELVAKLTQLQNYTQSITCANEENNLTITELKNSINKLQSVMTNQQNELASKNKQIEILIRSEDSLKKRVVHLQEEIVSFKIGSNQAGEETNVLVATNECSIHLTEELQDLITALYEEIDKTLEKDERIKKQNQNICCLQCVLTAKENELTVVHNELKMLQKQFNATLKEKQAMAVQLKKLPGKFTEDEEEEFARQCYCDET